MVSERCELVVVAGVALRCLLYAVLDVVSVVRGKLLSAVAVVIVVAVVARFVV